MVMADTQRAVVSVTDLAHNKYLDVGSPDSVGYRSLQPCLFTRPAPADWGMRYAYASYYHGC